MNLYIIRVVLPDGSKCWVTFDKTTFEYHNNETEAEILKKLAKRGIAGQFMKKVRGVIDYRNLWEARTIVLNNPEPWVLPTVKSNKKGKKK